MPSNMEAPSVAEVTTYLRQMKYPADRDTLLRCARESHAPEGVQRVIGRIGDRIYGGVAEVSQAVEQVLSKWHRLSDEDLVEEASEESFPASDPPAFASSRHIGKPPGEK